MNRSLGIVVLFIAFIFLSGYIGYALGSIKPVLPSSTSTNSNPIYQPDSGARIGPPSIIQSQQASATGKIVKVDGNGVTIQGDDGQNIAFSLAPKFAIYSINQAASQSATPQGSSNKADIKLNQPALITLELQGTRYYITTITYFPHKK